MDLADLTLGAKKNRIDPKPLIDMVMGFQKSQVSCDILLLVKIGCIISVKKILFMYVAHKIYYLLFLVALNLMLHMA